MNVPDCVLLEYSWLRFAYCVLDCVLLNVLACVLSGYSWLRFALQCLIVFWLLNPCCILTVHTMPDVNVNAPAEQASAMAPTTRTDDQILLRSRWVPIGKSNCYLDIEKQLSPRGKISQNRSGLYKLENLDIPHQVSKAVDEIVTDVVDWAFQAPLRDHFRDLPEANMKEILHHRIWETKSYEAHEYHKKLYEALEKSMDHDHSEQLLTDLAEARRKKKMRHESPKTPPGSPPHQPPPLPPPVGPSGTLGAFGASRSAQLPHHLPPPSTNQSDQSKSIAEYMAWMTNDTRLKPSVSSIPEDLHMDADSAPDEQVHSYNDEDIGNDHIPKVNLKQDWWKPLFEKDRPATPEPASSIPSSDLPVPMNN
ncbi:hypothetical protein Tco_1564418 [Tanacetum coccineum]